MTTKKQIDCAILDFSKAFDTVPHAKLLHKLSSYGITGPIHAWLSQFLSARSMRVVLDGESTNEVPVISGVPQGTVLGPLLFLCHINDLPQCVNSQIRLFADDCLLYRQINNQRDHLTLQSDLDNLQSWASTWGMRFNTRKCFIMSIRNKSQRFYTLNGEILHDVSSSPYLGITISNDLKWATHINKTAKKASSTIGFLRRNLKYCRTSGKHNAYISMVRSGLEYGSVIWDPYLKGDIAKLERVQHQAARFITGDYKSHEAGCMSSMLHDLQLLPLKERRYQNRLIFLYKIIEGLIPAIPPEQYLTPRRPGRNIRSTSFSDFVASNIVHQYACNNQRGFQVPAAKHDQYKSSFFCRTIVDWNHLSDSIVNSTTVGRFKGALGSLTFHD